MLCIIIIFYLPFWRCLLSTIWGLSAVYHLLSRVYHYNSLLAIYYFGRVQGSWSMNACWCLPGLCGEARIGSSRMSLGFRVEDHRWCFVYGLLLLLLLLLVFLFFLFIFFFSEKPPVLTSKEVVYVGQRREEGENLY